MKKFCLIAALGIALSACDTGEKVANLAPETRIFLEKINLSGDSRLNSVLDVYWSGEDRDGYVRGYELSLDGSTWNYTTATDSTFRFSLPLGADSVDIRFYARAIDNEGLTDPEPALLIVPVKNSPPVVKLDTLTSVPDTVYSVWSVLWNAFDTDGVETLDSVFVRVNDGGWYALSPQVSFLSFVPVQPELTGAQEAILYTGSDARKALKNIGGLRVGENNRIYVRARDIAGVYSPIDSSALFYLRRKESDLLVVDDHSEAVVDDVYRPALSTVYPVYDYLDISSTRPVFWDPTFRLLLGLYDKVFWYSDGTQLSALGLQLTLEVAATPLQQYLNEGGKLLVTTKFPTSFTTPSTGNRSAIFGFSPMDSLSTSTGQARISTGAKIIPLRAGFDTLQASAFITGADPFYAKDPTGNYYDAQVTAVGGWTGPSTIIGSSVFNNGRTNQVFVSVELHKLNGRPEALRAFLQTVLNDTFDW